MQQSSYKLLSFLFFAIFFSSCATTKQISNSSHINSLRFLGQYDVPHNMEFKGTTIGGLSGIDYDSVSGLYYLICDDRSAINPARFYTARIELDKKYQPIVKFVDVVTLLSKNGQPYPSSIRDAAHAPDPEAMRYNRINGTLVWTSEGERIEKKNAVILQDPSIIVINKNGSYSDTFPIPTQLHMHNTENGPRRNGVLEGICFADDYQTMYVSVEEPLYEDGPRAGLKDTATWIRIIKYDVASKQIIAQYAYHLDPIARPAIPEEAFKVNGVSDIMTLSGDKLLVIERSFSTGHMACTVKVYEADLRNATNINDVISLQLQPPGVTVKKKLLINMDSLGIYIDNIEGVTYGPVLPNGHKTLIFVADNNFSEEEKSQFLLFEIGK